MIFTKFAGQVAHRPRKKRLDFGTNPDLDPDLGIFLKEFYHCDIGSGKGSSSWLQQQSENAQAKADLRLSK